MSNKQWIDGTLNITYFSSSSCPRYIYCTCGNCDNGEFYMYCAALLQPYWLFWVPPSSSTLPGHWRALTCVNARDMCMSHCMCLGYDYNLFMPWFTSVACSKLSYLSKSKSQCGQEFPILSCSSRKYDHCKSYSVSLSCKPSHGCHQDHDVSVNTVLLSIGFDYRFDLMSNWLKTNRTKTRHMSTAFFCFVLFNLFIMFYY